MPIDVQFEGVDELVAGIHKLAAGVEDNAPTEFARVADEIANRVRGSVPRRTGALAASVQARREGKGAAVRMGDGVRYAQFVEYGGRGFPHNPQGNYLTPAAKDATPQLVAAGTRVVNKEIGAAW